MAVISGKAGDVLTGTGTPVQVAQIQKWSFNPKCNNPAYRSNLTAGYTARVVGNKDGSGSVSGKWDTALPITATLDVGTLITLNLVTTGVVTPKQFYLVPAVIDSLRLDVDLDTGEVVGWSLDFSSNGAWTNPVATTTLLEGAAGGTAPPTQAQAWAGFPGWGGPPQQPQQAPGVPAAAYSQQQWQAQQQPQQQQPQQPQQPGQPGQHFDPLTAAVAAQLPGIDPAALAHIVGAVVNVLRQQGMIQQPQQQAQRPAWAQAA